MNNIRLDQLLPLSGDPMGSLKLLMTALNSSLNGVVITDNSLPDNPIIYCNNAFEELSGYKRGEIIGRNGRFLQGTERDQKARATIKTAMNLGQPTIIEIRNYRKSGELFWNELHLSPVIDHNSIISHYIGIQHDITDRKNAEARANGKSPGSLQQDVTQLDTPILPLQYLNSIIKTIHQGLLIMNHEMGILSANDYFLNIFKLQKYEVMGKNIEDLGDAHWNIGYLKELLQQVIFYNKPLVNFELNHVFPHVGRKLLLLNANRIEIDTEYGHYLLLSMEDLTDLRAAEDRKDDFLFTSSHELKTPLTSIKGFNQVLKRFMPENTSSQILSIVEKSAQQIDKLELLVRDLVETSRMHTSYLTGTEEKFDFNQMVIDVVDKLKLDASCNDIHISGGVSTWPLGDRSQLGQVVENLLSNAIKYSPGKTQINIHLSEIGNYLKFAVTDFGIGINAEDLQHVFERFFRVSHAQKHFAGMGIGLYICKQIIFYHGGSIWGESDPGAGSTFSFTLPIDAISS